MALIRRNSPIFFLFAAGFLLLSFAELTLSAPHSALIQELPGFGGPLPSKHYSGYVNIGDTGVKNLFYYFVESEREPTKDPVVLWLNGGPGASSFLAFIYEHGPFKFQAGKSLPQLHINPYSWSKVSNIIYLDSPVGVGLSYSSDETDYRTGDYQVASDSHEFLLKWFDLYPEFRSNPFFISGESYAGVYVPMLAYEVLKGNDASLNPIINIKGYLVGNGASDSEINMKSVVPHAHGLGLVSDELFEEFTRECKGELYKPQGEVCKKILSELNDQVGGLNIYSTLEPCYHGKDFSDINGTVTMSRHGFRSLSVGSHLSMSERLAWPFRAYVLGENASSPPEILYGSVPCIDDRIAKAWLNNAAVRQAIHAEKKNVIGEWVVRSMKLNYSEPEKVNMIPYHKILTERGLGALIYSGDHDMVVPYTGSLAWIKAMGYETVDKWRPWSVDGVQVAGYTQSYANNLIFMTIKGAGHAVPETKPREALYMYAQFLAADGH